MVYVESKRKEAIQAVLEESNRDSYMADGR